MSRDFRKTNHILHNSDALEKRNIVIEVFVGCSKYWTNISLRLKSKVYFSDTKVRQTDMIIENENCTRHNIL